MEFALVIAGLATLAVTIFFCIKVVPAKYDGTFTKPALQKIHNYFNFKKLYLESVLKALFTFLTISCVIGGLSIATIGNIFEVVSRIIRSLDYGYSLRFSWIIGSVLRNLFGGVAIAVIGPIALRLVYEGILMFILLVKNVIEINSKMKSDKNTEE